MAHTKDQIHNGIDTAADLAKNAADRAAKAVSGGGVATFDAIKDTARSVATQVADTATAVGEKATNAAESGYNAAKDAGHKVQEWADDAYKVTADNMTHFGEEATAFVKKYPIHSLAIGFGVGFLLGRAAKAL